MSLTGRETTFLGSLLSTSGRGWLRVRYDASVPFRIDQSEG